MSNRSSLEDVKISNRQIIVSHMRGHGLISRTQLAQETGLSKATITRILGDLINEGLVEEVRTIESTVGRPHVLLRLVYRTRCAVGVELTATQARITLTDMNARPIKQRIRPVHTSNVITILDELAEEIKSLFKDITAELVGVGVAVPGVANVQTGVVTLELLDGQHEVPLVSMLSERVNLPVIAVNRAHAAAWGERWYEAGDPITDLLYIRLSTIVEAGVILNDRLHTGKSLAAGAVGHMTVDPQGDQCFCGNYGCLNTIASEPALLARARAQLKENSTSMLMAMVEGKPSFLTMNHLMRAVQAGDGLALQIFADTGKAIGVVVAGLLNLLNFERVIIGGQLSAAGPALLGPLQEEVIQRALPSSLIFSRVEITRLAADGASIGAASIVLQDPNYAYNPH